MPGKSRRKRGKQPRAARAETRQRTAAPSLAPAPEMGRQADVQSRAPAPRPSAVKAAPPSPVQPYIAAELRIIGILATLLLVALAVLYVILG